MTSQKIKIHRICLTIILIVVSFSVHAQGNPCIQYLPEYMPQSPTAQQIAKGIDFPVNYYSGIPDITIPLYQIEVGNLSVPVILTYQGGGIRPSQEATSVGLGWSLQAGGAVTRTVKCADDFMEYGASDSQYTVGYLERSSWPDFGVSFDYNYYRRIVSESGDRQYYLYVDSEPDIFFYSIPGNSGKFSFKKDNSIVYFDKSANIAFTPSRGTGQYPLFRAVDSQGTSYIFGEKERTHIYSASIGKNVNTSATGVDITYVAGDNTIHMVSDYTSTWYLTEMVSNTNDAITFEYEDEAYQLPLQENCRYQQRLSGSSQYQDGDGPVYSITKSEVQGRRLSCITWRGGHIDFEYGTARSDLLMPAAMSGNPKALTAVKVYNANGLLVCHWQLTYGYFDSTPSSVPSSRQHLFRRLRLESVRNMLTGDDPYTFAYNNTVPLPVKNTRNLDYWGFYNGSSQGNNYYCQSGSANKAVNEQYAQAGILQSISHPTGGTTTLHWESNKIGESIVVNNSFGQNTHDSYSEGMLRACIGGSGELPEQVSEAVILSQTTQITLLLSSKYVGSQTAPSSGGNAYFIERINNSGGNTPVALWAAGTIGSETEQTIVLSPGVYEFKCSPVACDVEYNMFYIDSRRKGNIMKSNSTTLYSCVGTEAGGMPATDTGDFTLTNHGVVIFNYFCFPCHEGTTVDFTAISPFSILRKKSDGSYETVSSWTVSDFDKDESKSISLDAGTYRVVCNAPVEDVYFSLAYSYGDTSYNAWSLINSVGNWSCSYLCAFSGNAFSYNGSSHGACVTDTIVLDNPVKAYLECFYENLDTNFNMQTIAGSFPLKIFRQTEMGTFEEACRIPVSCFADIDHPEYGIIGLYLDAGTYVLRCEAVTDDVAFTTLLLYNSTAPIGSTQGANRGGLRIARIEGAKDITYLYEGGKDMIAPCTYYKEDRYYDDATVTYAVRPAESVRPLSTLKSGNTIGYSKVVELFADNSRTEYVFHNEEEELEDADYPYSPSYTDWSNGLLLSKTDYDAGGNVAAVTSNSYQSFTTTASYMAGFMEIRPGYNHTYFQSVKCPKLAHRTVTEYRDGKEYTVRHALSYNANLLCSEESRQVGTDIHKTVYRYASDYTDDASLLMVERNMVGMPVLQLSARNGVYYAGTRHLYGNFNHLSDNGNTVTCGSRTLYDPEFKEMYLPTHLLTINSSNAATDISSCQFDTVIVYNSYNRFGKSRELHYKGMPIIYLWGYQGLYPVAEIKNATYQQFSACYGDFPPDRDEIVYEAPGTLRDNIIDACSNLSDVSAKVCLYTPLVGVTEINDEQGVRNTFSYDQAGRLSTASWVNRQTTDTHLLQSFSYTANTVTSQSFPTQDASNYIRNIQYYDSWGRASVKAAQGLQQNGAFSYSMQTYDALSRPHRAYVTIPVNNSTGTTMDESTFIQQSAAAFSGDAYGYSEATYDALGRTVETTMPGEAWNGQDKKANTSHYLTNDADEVKRYAVVNTVPVQQGCYAAGTLDCLTTADPDGITVRTYKDAFGNPVLERRTDSDSSYDTYYVYDDCNHLRFVLPPKYQMEANLGYYAYQYEYDGRGLVSKKTLPGCSPIRYWYDQADRLIRMQDGLLAATGSYREWTYDGLGRMLTQRLRPAVGAYQDEELHFYDDYNFVSTYSSLLPTGVSNMLPANSANASGQLTGTWKSVGNGVGMLTVMGYDGQGRPSKNTEVLFGQHLSVTDYTYNLAGSMLTETFSHHRLNTANHNAEKIVSGAITNSYSYPHTSLLTSSSISLSDNSNNTRTDVISQLSYDSFGNIWQSDRGGTKADMTYDYDPMHGWLTRVKSGGSFDQRLYRETEGDTPCFNGNISAMTWRTGNDYLRRFDYQYNGLDWLTQADFSYYSIGNPSSPSPTLTLIPFNGNSSENYSCVYYYDKNGNMTGAYRQGLVADEGNGLEYDTTDDYCAEYYGNQKRSVNGTGGIGNPSYYGSSAFIDGLEEGDDEYAYNANGSLTKDLNKSITGISYDAMNNLSQITFSGNRTIRYAYAADGRRLRTVHSRRYGNTWVKDSTEYYGRLVMKNGQPEMLHFPGGYISFSNGQLGDCLYYIQDYQGNNRMVVSSVGSVKQVTHYYPYGGIIGGISGGSTQKYKFGGNELDLAYGLEWYDIHARQYDPVLTSWHAIDPLAEKYYWISPYAYCNNNPVNNIDIDGRDWFSSLDSVGCDNGQTIWQTQIHYTDQTSQEQLDKNNINGTYLGKTVVLFDGYYDEKLGIDNTLDGSESKHATATVYGANGPNDITQYTAFTMTSNFDKYGAIQDGIYDGSYAGNNKPNHIPKPYVLENGGAINTIDGNRYENGYSKDQKNGIFIHRTNNNGTANGSVSLGCLLIKAQQMATFEKHVRRKPFKVILRRK